MNNVIHESERPRSNITWQTLRRLDHCEHQYEVIAHELGAALKRCVKCKRLEAE